MTIIRTSAAVLLLALATGLLIGCGGGAQQANTPPPQKVFPADKGPATIDVSKYPPDKQQAYKLFEERCAKCHTLARSVNANLFGEDAWKPVINTMATRAGSDVKPEEEKVLLDFVVFDHDQRKADIEKFWASQPK